MWGGGGRGGTIRKKIKTSLHNKNKSRTDHKKKKNARTRPSEAEKGKSRKIERVREIDKKGNQSMMHIYNVKVHFYSLFDAGVKHSLIVYTRLHDHFVTSNYRSFHFEALSWLKTPLPPGGIVCTIIF